MAEEQAIDRCRVLHLTAHNFKCLAEVDIDFDGNIHRVCGDAGQGKTATLEAIEAGLMGIDPSMVRNGAAEAEIVLELTEATIRRVLTADGNKRQSIKDKNGKTIEKAESFLKAIAGRGCFRPLEWVQLGRGDARGRTERLREQKRQLIEILPVKLTRERVLDAVKALGTVYSVAFQAVPTDGVNWQDNPFTIVQALEQAVYAYRYAKNASAEAAEAALDNTPKPKSAPKESEEDLRAALRTAREAHIVARTKQQSRGQLEQQRDRLAATIADAATTVPDIESVLETKNELARRRDENAAARLGHQGEIEELRRQIAALEAKVQECNTAALEIVTALEGCAAHERAIETQEARGRDLAALDAELGTAETALDLEKLEQCADAAEQRLEDKRQQQRYADALAAAASARETADLYNVLVRLFRDTLPAEMLSTVKLPVDGLSFDDNQILVNGVPMHQLGTSQQFRIGVLIASRMNRNSAFVLIDGAESMGRKDLAALASAAREEGLQLIMTFVDPDALPADGVTVMCDGAAMGRPQ